MPPKPPAPRKGSSEALPEEAVFILDRTEVAEVEMPWEAWTKIRPHPRARNVQKHAQAKHWKRKNDSPVLQEARRRVSAAELDGDWFQVDGITRSHLWATGQLAPPEKVHITLYRVASRAELNELFGTFDAATAARHQYDQVYGAAREAGVELTSHRMKQGYLISALQIALFGHDVPEGADEVREGFDVYEATSLFAPELVALDKISPKWDVFITGVIAAALVGLALKPQEVEFWQLLSEERGSKKQGLSDPIEALLTVIRETRREQAWSRPQQADLCARALNAWQTYTSTGVRKETMYKRKLRAIDLEPIINECREAKGLPALDAPKRPKRRPSRSDEEGEA